jgi:MFS family permease
MVVWGTIMALMCLVNSYQGLVMYCNPRHSPIFSLILSSARFFLGLAEGGLLPGLTYYLSLWYPRQMQSKRIGFFVAAAAVAGAFGGSSRTESNT